MQRVIIADDDFLVRTYLKQMIDWSGAGCTIAGEAKNGKEALALAREVKPALVITDICMPVMDGIELIKALRAESLAPHILVLSCHDDFHYVREAMLLGIDDYLLKDNLTPENILAYLAKHLGVGGGVSATKDVEGANGASVSSWADVGGVSGAATPGGLPATTAADSAVTGEKAADAATVELAKIGQAKLRADFLAAFTAGTLAGDIRAAAGRAGIAPARLTIAIRIDLRGWQERQAALDAAGLAAVRESMRELVAAAAARLVPSGSVELFAIDAPRGRLGLLVGQNATSTSAATKTAGELAAHIASSLRRYLNLGAVTIATAPQSSLAGLMPQWSRLAASEAPFYLADGCYQSSGLPALKDSAALSVAATTSVAAASGLTPTTTNAASTSVPNISLAQLAEYAREHRSTASARAEMSAAAGAPAALAARLATAESIADYEAMLAEHLAAAPATSYHPSIARALELIDEHYSEPITQPDIAAAVHLNAAYFSTLFKKNVGQGFRDYLAARRIEAVKRELKTSTARIKDIAAAAGFEDYPYFCRLFKQLIGLTAQEYRLQAIGGQ